MRRVAGHHRSYKMKEQEIIRSLASLLRDTGDSILSGRSTLSLTSTSLSILNQCFNSLNVGDLVTSFEVTPSNSPRFPVFNDIHFLFDFFQKTLSLKLIHGPGTLLVPTSITPFRALHSVEIKKIPLHHVQGLQSLRTRLRSLVCTRTLNSLQSLLEECGGDMSSALSWPELHTAVLSFNGLRHLDASLRLLPVLEVLDLSHNALVTTDIYLEYLTELKAVHLGFNQLRIIPKFAHTARSNLTTLMLNNNHLENIKGINDLVGLRDLRLDHNCLSDHVTLTPLQPLMRLLKLSLAGNPLSFHSNHRVLTAQHLNPTTATRVTLDGISFTHHEIQKCQRLTTSRIVNGYSSSGSLSSNLPGNSSHASLDLDFHYESTSTTGKSTSSTTSTRKRRPSRQRRPARKPMISEIDSNEEQTSPEISRVSTPVTQDTTDMKSHLTIAREQLGPDWLQTMAVQQQQQQQKRGTPPPRTTQQSAAYDSERIEPLLMSNNMPKTQAKTVAKRALNTNGFKAGGRRSNFMGHNLEVSHDPPSLQCSVVSSTTSDCAVDGLRLTECGTKPHQAINRKSNNAPSMDYSNPFVMDDLTSPEYDDRKNPFIDDDTNLLNGSKNPFEESSKQIKDNTNEFQDSLNPFMESNASLDGSTNPFDDEEEEAFVLDKSKPEEVFDDNLYHPNGLSRSPKDIDGKSDALLTVPKKTVPTDVMEISQPSDSSVDYDIVENSIVAMVTKKDSHVDEQNESKEHDEEDSTIYSETEHEDNFLWRSNSDVASQDQDLGEEINHYIVSLHGDDDDQIIITLTDRYILEKDINGTVIEKLDLNCLLSIQNIAERPLKGDNGINGGPTRLAKPPTLRLDFSYMKKDRRKRCYIMEDSASAESLMEHLEPILQAKNEEEQQRNLMQCLKCASQFSADHAPRRVRRTSVGPTVYGSSVEKGTLEEALSCPQCGSDLLISVDLKQTIPGSDASTPVSSHTNTPLGRSPVAGGFFKKLWQGAAGADDLASSYQSASSFRSAQEYFPGEASGRSDNPKSPHRSHAKLRNVHSSPSLTSLERKSPTDSVDSANATTSSGGRPRHSSDDSDICVLSQRPSLVSHISEDSEISVHSNPSLSSIMIIEPITAPEEPDVTPCEDQSYEGTPYGSLTTSTLSSMVDSIYEKSRLGLDTEDSDTTGKDRSSTFNSTTTQYQSVDEDYGTPRDLATPIPTSGNVLVRREVNTIQYWYDDFSKVDHNLRLYLDMSLFEHDAEEFKLIMRCSFVQFTKGEELLGLLVVTSHNFYILRITHDKSDKPPEQWLKKVHIQPLTELCYIDIGLGYQSLRFEFNNEASVFTFLIRDDHCCKTFLAQLTAVLNETSIQRASKLEGISKSNPQSMANLDVEVLLASGNGDEEDEEEKLEGSESEETGAVEGADVDATLSCYTLCYMHTGELDSKGESVNSSVSVVVTPSHVCLALEDHTWPVPRCSAPSNMKGPQFQLKDRQRIINITSADTCPKEHPELTLHFHDEDTDQTCSWRLILETQHMLDKLLEQIQQLWSDQFGVDLLVTKLSAIDR